MAESELVERTSETALARLDPQSLLMAAIDKGAQVETLERLVALAERVRAIQAAEAYQAAMAEFRRKCPRIVKSADAKISTRGGGSYSYRYAPLEDIVAAVGPILGECGLSHSWRHPATGAEKVASVCRITHRFGHFEESEPVVIPVPAQGESGATGPQRVGIGLTYGKRYSLNAILGLAPEDDDDAEHGDETNGGNGGRARSTGPASRVEDEGGRPADAGELVTDGQVKRFWAIARGAKPRAWSDEQVHELLTAFRTDSVQKIARGRYDAIVDDYLKLGPEKGLEALRKKAPAPAEPAAAAAADAQATGGEQGTQA